MSIKVLILAGSRPGVDAFARSENVPHKALIEVDGQTMLERVIAAASASCADEVIVAGDDPAVMQHARDLGAQVLPARHSPSATVGAAADSLGVPLLVTTADHVFLQPGWIDHLIGNTPEDRDLAVMLARREQIEQAMPGSQRTYLRFADGDWSGCNLFYLRTAEARRAVELWQRVEQHRKQPWRIAAGLGPGTLLMILTRRLTALEAIARLGAKVGVRATIVPAINGLAAVDVDKRKDLDQVRAYLAGTS